MRHGDLDINTARGLRVLRERIEAADIPASALDESLNFATWNIREFGRRPRLDAAIHYIAEIFNEFDLIAVTELRDKLDDLYRVIDILGPYWDVVLSDYNMDAAGNRERIAYVFDKRMVRFTGLAAEADAPRKKVGGRWQNAFDWWRSPYMASFRAGNFDFIVLAVHIRWGSGAAERERPLRELAEWVHKRRNDEAFGDRDIIVVGDMNIPSRDSDLYRAITRNGRGLKLPDALAALDETNATTNLSRRATYDQILHYPTRARRFTNNAGVLDFYCGDAQPLFPNRPDLLQRKKHTYQLSDHLPLWIQIDSWIEDEQLDSILSRA